MTARRVFMLGTIVIAMLVSHGSLTAQSKPDQPWPPPGVTRLGKGIDLPDVKPPTPVSMPKPRYTADARRARIQGVVLLEAIVDEKGNVGEVRVSRSLDREFGLDDEAVATLKQWQFKPATKDGTTIPVLVEVEISFTLK
jgi:TonB family protein